ncbi:hypothetical protein IMZ31_18915 (plasmid) [Pontibacillus sp. ALD_SL1]|uniref:hypothetical protein n=1 Tax=Pontibacillus sp. ALD_SL1 TaxID=2777185 RepID=UPI001A9746FE|nr:hypothetical protein [Pontibacillus sp. ALD_SL1]QST02621.1 hypothetical protein IMZ31_18915 [Pontibacillus sp. ALD_SL1]
MKPYRVVDVFGLTPEALEDRLNDLTEQGYARVFESNLNWYQGEGESGVIAFQYKKGDETHE